ncbi:unnamed protein product [Lota lota]
MAMETFFEEESGPHERPRRPRPRSKGGETVWLAGASCEAGLAVCGSCPSMGFTATQAQRDTHGGDTWGRRGYSATRFVRTAAHRQEHCFGHTGCEAPFMRSYSRNGALTEASSVGLLVELVPPLLEVPQDLHTQRDSPGPLSDMVSSVGLLRELVPLFWGSHKTPHL